jgi:hypothetical protein
MISVKAALYPVKLLLIALKKAITNFSIYVIRHLLFSAHIDPLARHIAQQDGCKTQRYVPIDH